MFTFRLKYRYRRHVCRCHLIYASGQRLDLYYYYYYLCAVLSHLYMFRLTEVLFSCVAHESLLIKILFYLKYILDIDICITFSSVLLFISCYVRLYFTCLVLHFMYAMLCSFCKFCNWMKEIIMYSRAQACRCVSCRRPAISQQKALSLRLRHV